MLIDVVDIANLKPLFSRTEVSTDRFIPVVGDLVSNGDLTYEVVRRKLTYAHGWFVVQLQCIEPRNWEQVIDQL